MKSLVFVFVFVPTLVMCLEMDIFNTLTQDANIWHCITNLNEKCVNKLGMKPVKELFDAQELRLGDHVSIEKLSNNSFEQRGINLHSWDLEELTSTAFQYLSSHALKFKFGELEARMFQSPSKPDNMEFTVEARRRNVGKSQKLYRVIIPLVIGFKITGLVIFGIMAVKLFLLKATLVANTALLVAGGIVMKKLYDHGMGMMTQHHAYLNSHQTLPNYYLNNHDFSGYGYNGYNGNGFEAASSMQPEVTDPVLGEPDLHGQFSNHAIALAALNKTLMQQHQPMPKRRWSHKWSPYGSHK